MWKLVQFECTECKHQFEDMIDTNGDGTVECPLCHHPAISTIGIPSHGKHLSWAAWRADQSIKE